jgi:hypothetical protein
VTDDWDGPSTPHAQKDLRNTWRFQTGTEGGEAHESAICMDYFTP